MTISDEAAKLKLEIAKLRPDKRRRYPDHLRHRIVEWAKRAMSSGISAQGCAAMLGMCRGGRISSWQQEEARRPVAMKENENVMALVPVAVEGFEVPQLVVVTPGGHRIEGLSFAQVRELITVLP